MTKTKRIYIIQIKTKQIKLLELKQNKNIFERSKYVL